MKKFDSIVRVLSISRIDQRLKAFKLISKISNLPKLQKNYFEIAGLDSEIRLKNGLNCITSPCDFYFRFLTVILREFIASFIVFMHFVTFFFENDSFPLFNLLFDLGMFYLSSLLSSTTAITGFLRGDIIDKKLLP